MQQCCERGSAGEGLGAGRNGGGGKGKAAGGTELKDQEERRNF